MKKRYITPECEKVAFNLEAPILSLSGRIREDKQLDGGDAWSNQRHWDANGSGMWGGN